MKATAKHLLLASVMAVVASSGLSGCASNKSYVVLMRNDDGKLGKVKVSARDGGSTLLDQQQQATVIGSKAGDTFLVADQQIASDFGFALAATPVLPVSFLLYFDYSNSKLTAASSKLIPEISEAISRHPSADVSIIGHTDTMGTDSYNDKLAMERAKMVSGLLNLQTKLGAGKLSIEAHGEKRLLVPTPDNTEEPRNRRVEVIVR